MVVRLNEARTWDGIMQRMGITLENKDVIKEEWLRLRRDMPAVFLPESTGITSKMINEIKDSANLRPETEAEFEAFVERVVLLMEEKGQLSSSDHTANVQMVKRSYGFYINRYFTTPRV